jgi:hypothetical protein
MTIRIVQESDVFDTLATVGEFHLQKLNSGQYRLVYAGVDVIREGSYEEVEKQFHLAMKTNRRSMDYNFEESMKLQQQEESEIKIPDCEGCLKEMDTMGFLQGYTICMDCVKARHKTVLRLGKCVCRKADKRPRETGNKSRKWLSCDRCLGTIKQLN